MHCKTSVQNPVSLILRISATHTHLLIYKIHCFAYLTKNEQQRPVFSQGIAADDQ